MSVRIENGKIVNNNGSFAVEVRTANSIYFLTPSETKRYIVPENFVETDHGIRLSGKIYNDSKPNDTTGNPIFTSSLTYVKFNDGTLVEAQPTAEIHLVSPKEGFVDEKGIRVVGVRTQNSSYSLIPDTGRPYIALASLVTFGRGNISVTGVLHDDAHNGKDVKTTSVQYFELEDGSLVAPDIRTTETSVLDKVQGARAFPAGHLLPA